MTLIFNGSPRKNGDTVAMIGAFCDEMGGEIEVIDAVGAQVSPCMDCRYCWENVGCCLDDVMQRIYDKIAQADCIILASPLYFSELTGSLLVMMSRLQCVYAARRFQKVQMVEKRKSGGVLLVGGGDGSPQPAIDRAKGLLKMMNAEYRGAALSLRTDVVPAAQDAAALAGAKSLAASCKEDVPQI